MQLFTASFIKYGAKCKCDLKNILLTISIQFHCLLSCITKSYLTDYLRLHVIYDAAVDLQVTISTTQLSKTVSELD